MCAFHLSTKCERLSEVMHKKNSAVFFTEFVEQLPLIVVGFKADGSVSIWNNQAKAITGFTREEACGSKPPGFLQSIFLSKKTASLTNDPHFKLKDHETIILTKKGSIKTIVWNSFQIGAQAQIEAEIVITGLDITKQKIYEETLSRSVEHIRTAHEQLKKYISHDPHTGLVNYRHFIARLNKTFRSSIEKHIPMALAVIDINYFNSINHTHGVSIGNRILREAAHLIEQNVEKTYTVARFSGTEFAILMPDTETAEAYVLLEKLYAMLTDHNFGKKNDIVKVRLSLSMALGGYPHCTDVFTAAQLLDRIVDKLDENKHAGGKGISLCSSDRLAAHDVYADSIAMEYNADFRYTMEFVNALANAVKIKDYYTQEHSCIMSNYATAMADYLGMSDADIQDVRIGAMLHDLGKIGIDKMILMKPAALTETEFEIIKQHPRIGAEIIRNVHPLKNVVPYVLYHHEKYNGKGYLHGLQGEEIPLGARIISLADVFQALTSDRPYRRALPEKVAFEIIKENSGKHFDPKTVKAFFAIYSSNKQITSSG